ncbi:MAG TPA: hypothetical protein VHZ54_12525 [Solirubrobacterales bacterium]|jgi:hypothetical protein|nr:hypothetical protein [Solirubrobacterales bacterium]
MNPFAEIVEVAPLLEAIWTSAVFGLVVLVVAGVGVSASLRAADQRSEHHQGSFASWSVVTVACGAILVAAIVLGIWAMTQ